MIERYSMIQRQAVSTVVLRQAPRTLADARVLVLEGVRASYMLKSEYNQMP